MKVREWVIGRKYSTVDTILLHPDAIPVSATLVNEKAYQFEVMFMVPKGLVDIEVRAGDGGD
jgi:hypothetical protein